MELVLFQIAWCLYRCWLTRCHWNRQLSETGLAAGARLAEGKKAGLKTPLPDLWWWVVAHISITLFIYLPKSHIYGSLTWIQPVLLLHRVKYSMKREETERDLMGFHLRTTICVTCLVLLHFLLLSVTAGGNNALHSLPVTVYHGHAAVIFAAMTIKLHTLHPVRYLV